MQRLCRLSQSAAFLAHHSRSLPQVGISSPAALVGVTGESLTSSLCDSRKFCSWLRSISGSIASYVHNLNSWSDRQVRYFSASKAMNSEPRISTSASESKVDAAAAKWREQGLWFQLTETCKLVILRGDITKWHVDGQADAIVNAANTRLLGGAGVDGAIHDNAGPALREACKKFPEVTRNVRCPTGEARLTGGFRLPVSRIIHTVGPIYEGNSSAKDQLTNAYRNSLALAVHEGVKYIAFPAISCGVYGYPVEEAVLVALKAVQEGCAGLDEVHFVLFDQKSYFTWKEEAESSLTKN